MVAVEIKVTDADEAAIAKLPESAWAAAVDTGGEIQDHCAVAEIADLNARTAGWPPGTRLIARRSRPSRRHERKLTDFEKTKGWRYQVTAIDFARMRGVPGSHHPWFADVLHRQRGGAAEGRVRVNKAMGLTRLPSKLWDINLGWVLAANLAADLDAPGPGSWACTARSTSQTPSPTPCATACGTCRPAWSPMPAAGSQDPR